MDLRKDADARSFVTQIYRELLGRDADEEGLKHYTRKLKSGASAIDLVAWLRDSDEYRARSRRDVFDTIANDRARQAVLDLEAGDPSPQGPDLFPEDYSPPGEAGRCYLARLRSGFLHRYCSGSLVLDVGFTGYDNPTGQTALPHAIGIDLDYPGYDGRTLPFDDAVVDTVFSSHCLEHILFDHLVIRDWFRVLKVGGFIVCMVPSQALYEKRRFLPSHFNEDHKRMYTPSSLLKSFEEALVVNSFRVRHLAENDAGFDYALGPDVHSDGAYEIELVIEKIQKPTWDLA